MNEGLEVNRRGCRRALEGISIDFSPMPQVKADTHGVPGPTSLQSRLGFPVSPVSNLFSKEALVSVSANPRLK